MIDLSIVVPAIRTTNWKRLYDSIEKSCKRHIWELILISPFDLPEELKPFNNIKHVKDFGHPTRCLQMGTFEAEGEMIFHTTDDALCLENSIDKSIDFYKTNCNHKDVVNMRYREGENYSGKSMPMDYWWAHSHDALRLPGIPANYKISLHHLINTEFLREMGGYDCKYEHANFSIHDLMFRIQHDGGKLYDSPVDVTTCDWSQKDHGPIEDSHNNHDLPTFRFEYSNPNILKQKTRIDLNNWADQAEIWTRRFKSFNVKEYSELLQV